MSVWQPWSLRALVRDLASGRVTADHALQRSRDRLAATESEVRAWVAVDDAPSAARPGPLHGVPMGVKDIIDLAGFPTRCGSALRQSALPAEKDAAVVERWRSAGARPLGKTATTEFAYFAPGPTRNPANLDHTPGGSSSGSAAAVAAGQVPLAIGSQTAGSVTRPASYCGVASLVMRHGRFPTDGVVGLSPSLDAHGVYAATVADLAVAWAGLTGDADHGASQDAPRIAVWSARDLDVVSSEMTSELTAAAARLSAQGAAVHDLSYESLIAEVTTAHPVVMAYEAARERTAELANAHRLSGPLATLLRTGSGIPDADYQAARALIRRARTTLVHAMAEYDVVLGPAAPGAAPRGCAATGDPILSRPWQALGFAAVAVPGLRSHEGLPLGVQVIAASESTALRAAAWIERHLCRPTA